MPEEKLARWERVGCKLHLYAGMPGRQAIEVRGTVDDQIIYRRWSRRRGWLYFTMDRYIFDLNIKDGAIKRRR